MSGIVGLIVILLGCAAAQIVLGIPWPLALLIVLIMAGAWESSQ